MKKLLISAALAAFIGGSAFADQAQPINYDTINQVLASIAQQALQAEQVKDSHGQDVLQNLNLAFDPKLTSEANRRIVFNAGVTLASSAWAPNQPSSLSLSFDASDALGQGSSPSTLSTKISAELKTDLPALIRFAYAKYTAQNDPCVNDGAAQASNPQEANFYKQACTELKQLANVSSVGDFIQVLQTVLDERIAYVNDRLAAIHSAGNADQSEVQSLNSELTNDTAVRDDLKKGLVTDSHGKVVGLNFDLSKQYPVTTGSEITALGVQLSDSSVALKVSVDSQEAATIFDQDYQSFEQQLEILQRPDTDPEKQQLKQEIQSALQSGLELAKEWILQTPASTH